MKLLSGTASIAKFLLTTFAAVAALGIGLSSVAFAEAAAPSPKTQSALGCLIGLGRDGCQTDFASARDAWQSTTYCTVQYIHRWLDNCFDGPLETVEYLGTNTAGADVYVVKYMHTYTTYVIPPPAPDGKTPGFWIKRGLPIQVIPSSLVAVRSPAHQLLYSRHG
jgi:hypothetical protein